MSDFRSSYDDSELPWLEAVDDEDGPRGFSSRKMLAALLVVFAAIAIIAATFFYLGRKDPAGIGAPELIRAEPGPYKVKPTDPGGLDVAGESETAFQTSAGEDSDAQLDSMRCPRKPSRARPSRSLKRRPSGSRPTRPRSRSSRSRRRPPRRRAAAPAA